MTLAKKEKMYRKFTKSTGSFLTRTFCGHTLLFFLLSNGIDKNRYVHYLYNETRPGFFLLSRTTEHVVTGVKETTVAPNDLKLRIQRKAHHALSIPLRIDSI